MKNLDSDARSTAYKFLSVHRVATLATIAVNGPPDLATIYYIVDEDLNLYFMTRIESRKYRNLKEQPMLSMVITDEGTMETIQLTGMSERIENFKDESAVLSKLWVADYAEQHWPGPAVKLYEAGHSAQLAVTKIIPTEMTYASFERQDKGNYKSFFLSVIKP